MRAAVLLLALALIPVAGADDLVRPVDGCGDARVHAYTTLSSHTPARSVATTPAPGCGADVDPVYGVGGAFLPADHHGDQVCIADDVSLAAEFYVGTDADGDGVIAPVMGVDGMDGPFRGCVPLPAEPGRDGGWWIVLGREAFAGQIVS